MRQPPLPRRQKTRSGTWQSMDNRTVHSHCVTWTSSIEPKSSHRATWPGERASPNGCRSLPLTRLSKSCKTAQMRSMTLLFVNYSPSRPSLTKRRMREGKAMVRAQRATKAMQKQHRRQIPRRTSMRKLLMECFTIAQTNKPTEYLSQKRTLG